MEPPLPPKNEFNSAPVPPPRRNKRATRTGTPNSQNQVIFQGPILHKRGFDGRIIRITSRYRYDFSLKKC